MLFLLQQNTGFWVPFLRDRRPVYYEQQVKRELKRVHISGYRCNERLKAETDGSKRLTYTGLRGDLEHLTMWWVVCQEPKIVVCYEVIKRDLNRRRI